MTTAQCYVDSYNSLGSGTSPTTFNLTIASNANLVIVIALSIGGVTGVTVGGTAMTAQSDSGSAPGVPQRAQVFGLWNPPTGTQSIVASGFGGGNGTGFLITAVSFIGAVTETVRLTSVSSSNQQNPSVWGGGIGWNESLCQTTDSSGSNNHGQTMSAWQIKWTTDNSGSWACTAVEVRGDVDSGIGIYLAGATHYANTLSVDTQATVSMATSHPAGAMAAGTWYYTFNTLPPDLMVDTTATVSVDSGPNGYNLTPASPIRDRTQPATSPWSGFGVAPYFASSFRSSYSSGLSAGTAPKIAAGAGSQFCIEAKFKVTALNISGIIAGRYTSYQSVGGAQPVIWVSTGSGALVLNGGVRDNGGTWRTLTSTTTFGPGSAHDACLDYDGTTMRLWLDGTAQGTIALSGVEAGDSTTRFMIGRDDDSLQTTITDSGYPFVGFIDEVRLSNVSRHTTAYTPATTPFTSDASTVGLWHLDDIVRPAPLKQNNFGGSMGGCIVFDDTQHGICSPPISTAGLTAVTLELKVGRVRQSITEVFCSWDDYDAHTNNALVFDIYFNSADNKLYCYQYNGSGGNSTGLSSTATVANGTHDVAITWDGTTWKMYLDGVFQSSVAYAISTATTCRVNLGRFGPKCGGNSYTDNAVPYPFKGQIDEVRLSNVVRYSANYTPSTTPFTPDANTMLLWHCDDVYPYSSTPITAQGGLIETAQAVQRASVW